MKKIRILFILLFTYLSVLPINSQTLHNSYNVALEKFNSQDYAGAYEKFILLIEKENLPEIYSSSFYYGAQCLIALNQKDGAASLLNSFVKKYFASGFRDKALYQLGTIYFELQRYQESRDILSELLDYYSDSYFTGSAYYWIGETYIREGAYKEAADFLLSAVGNERNNRFIDYTLFSLATVYEKQNIFDNAVKYYEQLLAHYYESKTAPFAQLRLGICLFKQKEYDRAVLELSDPLLLSLPLELQKEAKLLLANTYFRLEEFKEAKSTFQDVLSADTASVKSADILYNLAWVNFNTEDYNEAFNLFDKVSKEGADSLKMLSTFWKAEAKRYAGDEKTAFQIYEEFKTSYPNANLISNLNFNKAIIFYNQNKFKEALEFLDLSIASGSESVKIKSQILSGEILLYQQNFKEAKERFKKALLNKIPVDHEFRAKLGLGISDYYTNNFKDAISVLGDLQNHNRRFEKDKINLYLAESYFAAGDFSSALTHYNKITPTDQKILPILLYGKACSYFNVKDFANAAYYFNDFAAKYKNDKNTLEAKLKLAECHYGLKDFAQAAKAYEEVIRYNKGMINDPNVYYQYGQSLFKSSNFVAAVNRFQELQAKFPKSDLVDDAQYLIGWMNFQQGNYNSAISEYRVIIDKYAKSGTVPLAVYSIADCYYNLGSYDSALVYYNSVIRNYPNTSFVFDAINGITYAYLVNDKLDEAVNTIDNFLQQNPKSQVAEKLILKKGEIYYSQGLYKESQAVYTNFVNLYPGSAFIGDAHYWAGKSAANLNNINTAEFFLNYVIKNYKGTESSLNSAVELGRLYSQNQNYQAEVNLYQSVEGSFGDADKNSEISFLKGMAYANSGDITQAYTTFSNLSSSPAATMFSDKAKIELAIIELARKKYKAAETLLIEVSSERKDDIGAKAQYYLGLNFFEQRMFDDAITALVRVRSVFSGYDEWFIRSLLKLGDCYVELKDYKKAREMYAAVKKHHPNDEFGNEAKEKLDKL